MSIHVALRHVTQYKYDRAVELSPQLVRLRPAPHCRTPILSYSQRITPSDHFLNWMQDPQSNYVARVTFAEKVEAFRVEINLVAEMAVYNPFDFFLEPSAEHFPFSLQHVRALRAAAVSARRAAHAAPVPLSRRHRSPATADYRFPGRCQPPAATDISYVIRLDPGVQEVERTLELESGSCRDTTWLLVQLFRHLGLASRFVVRLFDPVGSRRESAGRPTGADRDFTDLHAWCEVYCLVPAGSASIRRRDCSPAKGTFHSHVRPIQRELRRCPVASKHARSTSSTRCRCSGSPNRRVSPSPTPTRSGKRSSRAGARSTPTCPPASTSDDGRRADIRIDDGSRRGRMEHRRARTDKARARRGFAVSAEAALRCERLHPYGTGQVVPRRTVAAVGARVLLACRR